MSSNEYIPVSTLHNLKKYKYQAIDKSPVSKYILAGYWEYVVSFVPLWLAPNMVTLIGLFHVLAAYILIVIYSPDLSNNAPGWVYITQGIFFWIYGTLDAIDGKQARRTGQSGPLGELFDHGCDSLTVPIGLMLQCICFGFGSSWKTLFFMSTGLINFYVSTVEEYHTGILYLGYISGAVEGILFLAVSLIVSGIYGTSIWTTPIRNLTSYTDRIFYIFQDTFLFDINIGDFIFYFLAIGIFPTVLASYRHIYAKTKMLKISISPAIKDMLPLVYYFGAIYVWLTNSPQIVEKHLLLFLSTVTFGYSYIVGRVIVAHVTKASIPKLNFMHIPIILGAILSFEAFKM
ncbi:hypothetical protein BB561_000243 [Smittium simulii]|uniref:Uncharacterized protein n=1 Tax=Smittium simulii TaxID=133385 RepID=A0A2T9YZT3_9FUNG|nr:hypothetical protein BB561_000243 [Smittium simulii]